MLDIVVIAGTIYIVFCLRRGKPIFVKVILVLLNAIALSDTIVAIVAHIYNNTEGESHPKLDKITETFKTLSETLVSIAHWLFAVKYYELSLRLPVFVRTICQGPVPSLEQLIEQERAQRHVDKVMIWANIAFYVTLFVITVVDVVEGKQKLPFTLSTLTKLVSAILLMVAICRLRSLVKHLKDDQLSNREFLMTVHTVLFNVFIGATLAYQITLYML